jgi:hypothetical protein
LYATVLAIISTTTHAELFDRGNGMIYDDDLDITWLQDANPIGWVSWDTANAWAESLVYGGFDDWRLPYTPQMDPTCVSIQTVDFLSYQDCTGGELGHLFYTELGNFYSTDYLDIINNYYGPFFNIQTGYWTSTRFDPTLEWPTDTGAMIPNNDDYHWLFYLNKGDKFVFGDGNSRAAIAVRDGDVITPALPGDINFDGQVNVADYLLLTQFVLGIRSTQTTAEHDAGDMNLNGQLDTGDLVIHLDTVM